MSYVSFLEVPEAVLRLVELQLAGQAEESEPVFSSTQEKHTCVRCKVQFESLAEQRTHFRSEWHRFNLQVHTHTHPCGLGLAHRFAHFFAFLC